MYPPCDIDKVTERGETWPVDPELRDALNQLTVDLRGEIRSGDAETREALDRLGADLRGEIRTAVVEMRSYVDDRLQTTTAETRAYVGDLLQTTTAETRRYFDVVGESLRSDIRGVAELLALSNEGSKVRDDEQAARTDGLEGRVGRLEVRVMSLEDDRKPRPPRRRR